MLLVDTQRILITSLIAFANAVSGEIGAIMSPYFVGNGLTPEEGTIQLNKYRKEQHQTTDLFPSHSDLIRDVPEPGVLSRGTGKEEEPA